MSNPKWPSVPFYIQINRGRRRSLVQAIEVPPFFGIAVEAVAPCASVLWVAAKVGSRAGPEVACLLPCGVFNPLETSEPEVQYALSVEIDSTGKCGAAVLLKPLDPTDSGQWFILQGEEDAELKKIVSYVDTSKVLDTAEKDGNYSLVMWEEKKDGDISNQEYRLISEEGALTAIDLRFGDDISATPPLTGVGSSVTVDNSLGPDVVTVNVELQYTGIDTETSTFSTTKSRATTVTASLGLSGAISKALTINASGEVSTTETESTTFGNETSHTDNRAYTQSLSVSVASGSCVTYTMKVAMVRISASKASIKARLDSSIPGANPFELVIPGSYSAMQMVDVYVEVPGSKDLAPNRVASIPPPKIAEGSRVILK